MEILESRAGCGLVRIALCIGERYGKNNDKTLVLSQQISDIILFNKLVPFFIKKKKNPIGKW